MFFDKSLSAHVCCFFQSRELFQRKFFDIVNLLVKSSVSITERNSAFAIWERNRRLE